MKPRNASTLIINNKPTAAENSILMLLRHPGNAFVPSAWVFPGGAVENEDQSLKEFCVPFQENNNQMPETEDDTILPYLIASIRETFEETGILYAYKNKELLEINTDNDILLYHEYRDNLNNGYIGFRDIVEKENLTLATDCLTYFDRWVTPALYPIRYDARFFYTDIVPRQTVKIDEKEVIQYKWISPDEAIKGNSKGDFPMVLPTVSVLKKII